MKAEANQEGRDTVMGEEYCPESMGRRDQAHKMKKAKETFGE